MLELDPETLRNVSLDMRGFSAESYRGAGEVPGNAGESWNWSQIRERCSVEARRMLRQPQDAEEVVQEALARAWRSRRACRTPETPLPWCLQITRNEALRLMQRQRLMWTELLDPQAE